MSQNNYFKLNIFILVILVISTNCSDERITEPNYNNPFDYHNWEEAGDPFNMQAVINRWDVKITWTQPIKAVYRNSFDYHIYRSDQENTNFAKLSGIISGSMEVGFYYEDDSIDNGHTYWYKVATLGNDNTTSSLEALKPLRVDIPKLVTGTVTDIDDNVYKTVKINDQWWMAENLKVTHYRNGDPIPRVTDNEAWSNLTTGAYSNYDNNEANVATYGRLYNWYAVNDNRGLAPAGWHVPTDAEWKTLVDYLVGNTEAGGKMKEADMVHWQSPNTGADNSSGFTALPGGYRDGYGFGGIGGLAYFWSSTEYEYDTYYYAWYRSLSWDLADIQRYTNYKPRGFSVRCVRDN